MRGLGFLIFVALTVICWGVYGPVLHQGQHAMGADGQLSSLRPFICVGIAYFLIAVLFPIFVLYGKGEKGHWTIGGFFWSFVAGALGAVGALGIILAFKFQGKPAYVMPLVFGGAPVVNTLVTMAMSRTFKEASPFFYAGVIIVAIGAAGVLTFKPKEAAHAPAVAKSVSVETNEKASSPSSESESKSDSKTADVSEQKSAGSTTDSKPVSTQPQSANYFMIIFSIALTALCWGTYGPVLHCGQMEMGQSRLRPFLCVGLAYFLIAVVATYFMLPVFPEAGGWTFIGITWSLLGGVAGAFGALGIIYAFNAGGKPIFVMPLVFGLAPVVNTFSEMVTKGLYDQIPRPFYLSLALTILGAVTVLVCAPKSHAKQLTVEKTVDPYQS